MYIEIVIQCMCALQKNTLVYQVYQSNIVAKILLLKKWLLLYYAGPKVNTNIIMNQIIDILDFISISGKGK